MAKVYGPPAAMKVPDLLDFRKGQYEYDIEAYNKAENTFVSDLAAWCRHRHPGNELVGEIVRFPAGDGYAIYVVASAKPLALVHVPVGDAWAIPAAHARGLRLQDVAEMVRQRKALEAVVRKPTA